jgi:hypothetical protein
VSQSNSTGKTLLTIAALIFLSSAYLYYNTYSFPPPVVPNAPGPATLPRMVLAGIFICLPFAVFEALKQHRVATERTGVMVEYKEMALMLSLVILFSVFLEQLGFEIVAAVLLFVLLWSTTRNVRQSFVLTVGGVLTCYVIFIALLKVYVQTSFLPMRPLQFVGY